MVLTQGYQISQGLAVSGIEYREFSPYANFITANFVAAVFQNYYYNFTNAILWATYFVSAFIS